MSARDQCYCGTWHQQTDVAHIGSHGDGESDSTGSRIVGVLHVTVAAVRRDSQGVRVCDDMIRRTEKLHACVVSVVIFRDASGVNAVQAP